jgi:hypothetical protein
VEGGSDPGHRWSLRDVRSTFEFIAIMAYFKNVAWLSIQSSKTSCATGVFEFLNNAWSHIPVITMP